MKEESLSFWQGVVPFKSPEKTPVVSPEALAEISAEEREVHLQIISDILNLRAVDADLLQVLLVPDGYLHFNMTLTDEFDLIDPETVEYIYYGLFLTTFYLAEHYTGTEPSVSEELLHLCEKLRESLLWGNGRQRLTAFRKQLSESEEDWEERGDALRAAVQGQVEQSTVAA